MFIRADMKLTPSQLIACFLLADKQNVKTSERSGTSRGLDILSAYRPLAERMFERTSPPPFRGGGEKWECEGFHPSRGKFENKEFSRRGFNVC